MRGQKGITLVALIITIIVLLILAVVAIGAVTDSDIIGHAEDAADTYNAAQANEVKEIQTAENVLDNILANVAN